jgi:hypothetical protein
MPPNDLYTWLTLASHQTVTRRIAEIFLYKEQVHNTTRNHRSLLQKEMKEKNGKFRGFLRRLLNQPKKAKKQ